MLKAAFRKSRTKTVERLKPLSNETYLKQDLGNPVRKTYLKQDLGNPVSKTYLKQDLGNPVRKTYLKQNLEKADPKKKIYKK